MPVTTTLNTKKKGRQRLEKFLREITLLLNPRFSKIKVNITKAANVKLLIAKRNIVNALSEE
tara:strand:- start:870 stop:1055 length:186 start_codon:yes stop_codon:yes gene_type:complete